MLLSPSKVFTVLFLCLVVEVPLALSGKEREIMNRLFDDYDEIELPSANSQTQVNISMYITQISLVTDSDHSYLQLRMALRQRWNDPRLAYHERDNSVSLLRLPFSLYDKHVWKPDLYIENGASFEIQKGYNEYGVFNVRPYGDILSSSVVKLRTYCNLDFYKFPFDTQNCSVIIQSYTYPDYEMRLAWHDEFSVSLAPDLMLPEIQLYNCTWISIEKAYSTGNWTELRVSFEFGRSVSHYIVLYYFPATVLVMASCLALWIPKDKITARAVISVLSLHGVLVLLYLAKSATGAINYFTNIVAYLFICFFYVFFVLVVCVGQFFFARFFDKSNGNGANGDSSGEAKTKMTIIDVIVAMGIPGTFVAVFFLYCVGTAMSQ